MSTIVIKVGGEIFKGGELGAVARDVATASARGDRVVVIHGGGPQATAMQKALGQTPRVVAGRRITDEATLEVMKMTVGGQLNIDLCAALLRAGARPVGMSGASSCVIEGRKRPPTRVSGGGDELIDFGLVGDVIGINHELLSLLLLAGYIPVLACLAADSQGMVLNINADAVANQVAAALAADHLVLVTGTPGVLRDIEDVSSRIPRLTAGEAHAAIADGSVSGGMIPKLEESMQVLASGKVGSVHIVGSVEPGDLLREIDEPGALGTVLLP